MRHRTLCLLLALPAVRCASAAPAPRVAGPNAQGYDCGGDAPSAIVAGRAIYPAFRATEGRARACASSSSPSTAGPLADVCARRACVAVLATDARDARDIVKLNCVFERLRALDALLDRTGDVADAPAAREARALATQASRCIGEESAGTGAIADVPASTRAP